MVENGKYYIYRHVTLNDIVFYIGRGTKDQKDIQYGIYSRAKSKKDRTSFWRNVVDKYGYTIDILLETDDFDFLCKKEIEFIKLYGRRKLKTGTLVNFNEGGETGGGNSKAIQKRVYMYDSDGKYIKSFNSLKNAAKRFGTTSGTIAGCCSTRQKHFKNYQFRMFWSQNIGKIEYKNVINRKVLAINVITGEEMIYKNSKEASDKLKIPRKTIGNNLCGLSKTIKRGYKFKYIENE